MTPLEEKPRGPAAAPDLAPDRARQEGRGSSLAVLVGAAPVGRNGARAAGTAMANHASVSTVPSSVKVRPSVSPWKNALYAVVSRSAAISPRDCAAANI